jgi:hypothetical protein
VQKLGHEEKLHLRNLLAFHTSGKRYEVTAAYYEQNRYMYLVRAGFATFEPVPGDSSRYWHDLTPAGIELAQSLPAMKLGGYTL